MMTHIFPKRIFASDGVKADHLYEKQPLQIGLSERKTTVLETNDYLILDFGAEVCGGVRILTYHASNVSVRIRFGESLGECCSDLGGTTNATNDHSLRDFSVDLQHYSDMTFGQTGFRFVRLDASGHLELKCIVATNHMLKQPSRYRYEGRDQTIRAIYNAAKRTIDLCASQGWVWDGIKRDRLVWIGDMAPEVIALTTLYGRLACIERSLDFVKDQTPLPGWMNGMPAYSMWWMIILSEYYERTGARDYVGRQMAYLSELIRQMDGCIRADGTLDYPSYFVDWPTHGQPDEQMGVRAINVIALTKAIRLLRAFEQDASLAEELLARLRKIEIVVQKSKQVLALKYFATGLSECEREMLVAGGAQGMSTFMSYYILTAVASFDKTQAVEMMKEYFGGMLDKGATAFWEDFDLEWCKNSSRIDEFPKENEQDLHGGFGAFCYQGFRHSLCHGWSAGVIGFMKEQNL